MRICRLILLLLIPLGGFSQVEIPLEQHRNAKKGDLFFYWGYNRASYNKSDLWLQGDGYSIKLHNVEAKDVPETFDAKVYFNPKKITIPQFNVRIGYSISDNWTITAGYDHLKYKLLQNQVVRIEGFIDKSVSTKYAGDYVPGDVIALDEDFLRFEHSNGLNFGRIGLEYRAPVWMSKNAKHQVNFFPSVSAGPVVPWTDYTFMNNRYKNFLHFSGFGVAANMTVRYDFLKHFFFQLQSQVGWIHLPHINLEDDGDARGRQSISFMERSFALGFYIHSFRK